MASRPMLSLLAVALFALSGASILQMPRADRRTLFIFPAFLSVVVGGSMTVYSYENISRWFILAAVAPFLVVHFAAHLAPKWVWTLCSYASLAGALVSTDILLDYGFR